MATTIFPQPAPSSAPRLSGTHLNVSLLLAVWLVLVLSLGASGAFVGRPGSPPIGMAIGVGAPLVIFFGWLRMSQAFRDYLLSLDLRLIVAIQAWRWAGLGFLALYAHNVLPPLFALTAGLGDMAVGFAAPWMVLALIRQPDYAATAAFIRWNVLGIVDLVVAITLGTLSVVLSTGAPGEISAAPMATLPLLLIPAFLVPLFLMLHSIALMQIRRKVRANS
jgi:hypothetical protein